MNQGDSRNTLFMHFWVNDWFSSLHKGPSSKLNLEGNKFKKLVEANFSYVIGAWVHKEFP